MLSAKFDGALSVTRVECCAMNKRFFVAWTKRIRLDFDIVGALGLRV
jgi:hypothetical protein